MLTARLYSQEYSSIRVTVRILCRCASPKLKLIRGGLQVVNRLLWVCHVRHMHRRDLAAASRTVQAEVEARGVDVVVEVGKPFWRA